MKKAFIIAGVVVGIGVLLRRLLGDGEGWEARLARMPDSSPPKWMFTNIAAIRENTEKILTRIDTPPVAE
jgi:hypothetical protein